MTFPLCQRLGGLHEAAAAVGIFVEIHVLCSLGLSRKPEAAQPEHRHWVMDCSGRGFPDRDQGADLPRVTDTHGPLKGDPQRFNMGGSIGRWKGPNRGNNSFFPRPCGCFLILLTSPGKEGSAS